MAMISSLQLLRFGAASLIVFNHSAQEFAGSPTFGEFGVDIFFVISGFIISHITQSGDEQFFTRRLIRIVPLYWLLTCAITAIAYFAPFLLHHVKWNVFHAIASLLFVPWWTETLKFSPILPMGWTLNYEIWFYLLFSVAMRISLAHREVVCALLIVGVYTMTSGIPLGNTASLSFYSNSIVLEFIFGMAIAVLYRRKKAALDHMPLIVVLPLAVAVLFAWHYTTFVNNLDLPRFVYWGLPAVSCVFVCLSAEKRFNQFPRRIISAALAGGELSYPVYLIHMFIIAALSRVVGVSHMNVLEGFAVALVLSSVASYMALHWYDKPIRRMLSDVLLKRSSPA